MEQETSDFLIYYVSNIPTGNMYYETRGKVDVECLSVHINSNELTKHHRPHVHIKCEGINYVCSIDDTIQILEPQKYRTNIANFICSTIANIQNLSKCRTEWNRCKTLKKFKKEEIDFKSITVTKKENCIIVKTQA